MADKNPLPRTFSHPHCQRQHRELNEPWIPAGMTTEKRPAKHLPTGRPGQTRPFPRGEGQDHSQSISRRITHSLDRAWLFWNSSSGNMCSWFRFSRLKERRKEGLEGALQSRKHKNFSESPGFRVGGRGVQIRRGSLCCYPQENELPWASVSMSGSSASTLGEDGH